MNAEFRAGFACLVGRPNAGKSTLTNALVGQKVAITSSKPQTTRHTIRGIATAPAAQLILVDTPGLHKPRTLLGQRLNDLVRETLLEVDVIGFCLPADQKDRPRRHATSPRELAELQRASAARWSRSRPRPTGWTGDRLAEHLIAIDQLGTWDAIVPCSATRGDQVEEVADVLVELPAAVAAALPRRRAHRRAGGGHDRRAGARGGAGGRARRAAAQPGGRRRRDGAARGPPDDDPLLDVRVNVFVERPSQKAIVIGRGGSRLREVGTNARARDRGAARPAGPPRPARQGRQGLAARPQAAAAPRLLTRDGRCGGPGSSRAP